MERAESYELAFGLRVSRPLLFDVHSPPEGHEALDLAGGGLGIGVVPGRVGILVPIDQKAQVAGLPLPRTGRSGTAGTKVFALEARFRKIDVSFHRLRNITFGDNLAIPECSCHGVIQ